VRAEQGARQPGSSINLTTAQLCAFEFTKQIVYPTDFNRQIKPSSGQQTFYESFPLDSELGGYFQADDWERGEWDETWERSWAFAGYNNSTFVDARVDSGCGDMGTRSSEYTKYDPVYGQVWMASGSNAKLELKTSSASAFSGTMKSALDATLDTTGNMHIHHTIGTGNGGSLGFTLSYAIFSATYGVTGDCKMATTACAALRLDNDATVRNDEITHDVDDAGWWDPEDDWSLGLQVQYSTQTFDSI